MLVSENRSPPTPPPPPAFGFLGIIKRFILGGEGYIGIDKGARQQAGGTQDVEVWRFLKKIVIMRVAIFTSL